MAVTLSLLALCVSGAIANSCPADGIGEVITKTVTRTNIVTQWGDYTHPFPSATTSGHGHGGHAGSSKSLTTTSGYGHGGHSSSTKSLTTTKYGNGTSTTTSSPTSTASTYINYSAVTGYFVQDDNATSPDGFDYSLYNFGLINQTYDTDTDASLTQWQRFAKKLEDLQDNAPTNVQYKLAFMGRHGEGNHNAMESYVGTPAWNCYWALLEGANSSFIYADAPVTEDGIEQAVKANAYWASRIAEEKIPFVESYYTSPMRRCLETAELTFASLDLPKKHPFKPTIKEGLREGSFPTHSPTNPYSLPTLLTKTP
jgi:hypothetical protein